MAAVAPLANQHVIQPSVSKQHALIGATFRKVGALRSQHRRWNADVGRSVRNCLNRDGAEATAPTPVQVEIEQNLHQEM